MPDVERIATDPAPASFENTIVALERSGESLDRVAGVFFNKCSSDTSPELQEIEAEISAQLAKQHSEIYTDARLFARVDGLTGTKASLGLDPQAERVLDLYHEAFMRAGARLDEAGRARMSEISQRLASLGANFGKNVLADEKDIEIIIEDEAGLVGLPKGVIAAMAQAAEERGHAGKWLVTTLRSSAESFLQYSTRRDLREAVWRGFVARGAWLRRCACVLSVRACSALMISRPSSSTIKWPNDPKMCVTCSRGSGAERVSNRLRRRKRCKV